MQFEAMETTWTDDAARLQFEFLQQQIVSAFAVPLHLQGARAAALEQFIIRQQEATAAMAAECVRLYSTHTTPVIRLF